MTVNELMTKLEELPQDYEVEASLYTEENPCLKVSKKRSEDDAYTKVYLLWL